MGEREQWDNKLQFLLALVGYAVGLGNVWRFPYLAQKNGGGCFLIPYLTMLSLIGVPLLALELGVGQRLRKGPWQAYSNISRFTFGMGIASVVASLGVAAYYNTVIAWCLYYFVVSFQYPLPWEKCPQTFDPVTNTSVPVQECAQSSDVQYYWNRKVLNISPGIDDPGEFNFPMASSIFVAWFILFVCMFKGIKSQGKVIYFTSTFPYVLLTAFLIKGLSLPGSLEGIKFLFRPDFSKLLDGHVWLAAAEQIFYSLGLAGGSCIAMASYMPHHNNFLLDTVCIAVINTCTSLYAACVIFSVLGYIALSKSQKCLTGLGLDSSLAGTLTASTANVTGIDASGCTVEAFMEKGISGSGLAFMTMAEVCVEFGPSGPVWAALFYFMLITLGLDSTFGTLESVFASILDFKSTNKYLKTPFVSGVICLLSFLFALCFAAGSGEYVFQMFDNYAGALPFVLLGIFECIAIAWVYGLDQFSDDIQLMTGMRPPFLLKACWMYLSPLILAVAFVWGALFSILRDGAMYAIWVAEKGVQEDVPYPTWAQYTCMFLTSLSIVWMPLIALAEAVGLHFPQFPRSDFPVDELRKIHPEDNYEPSFIDQKFFRITLSRSYRATGVDLAKSNGGADSTVLALDGKNDFNDKQVADTQA
ncbi:sodium-dependent neutral amino acid transporter B(0)AT3-like [Symsagittifera roscoffensis]|uniref:sodium-dependent neutral amino acid transporter B(0)AT3-like n=1 Tax=Symsagittifera roscoffensis TaxID=84072 RepID=UPI00307B81E9